jgi:glucose/arabinose dehydrogenase
LEVDPQTGRLANTEPQPFVTGFWLSEEPGDYLGRPYDLTMTEDGVIFISDDAAGAVYELRRKS